MIRYQQSLIGNSCPPGVGSAVEVSWQSSMEFLEQDGQFYRFSHLEYGPRANDQLTTTQFKPGDLTRVTPISIKTIHQRLQCFCCLTLRPCFPLVTPGAHSRLHRKLRYSTLLLYSYSCCRKKLLTQPPYLGETWYAGHPKHEATEVDSVQAPAQEFQNEMFATFASISAQAPEKCPLKASFPLHYGLFQLAGEVTSDQSPCTGRCTFPD